MIQYGLGNSNELVMDVTSHSLVDEDTDAKYLFQRMRTLVQEEWTAATMEDRRNDDALYWINRNPDAAACLNQLADRVGILEGELMAKLSNSETPQQKRDRVRAAIGNARTHGLFNSVANLFR